MASQKVQKVLSKKYFFCGSDNKRAGGNGEQPIIPHCNGRVKYIGKAEPDDHKNMNSEQNRREDERGLLY